MRLAIFTTDARPRSFRGQVSKQYLERMRVKGVCSKLRQDALIGGGKFDCFRVAAHSDKLVGVVAESFCGASFRLGRFFVTASRRSAGFQRVQEPGGDGCNLIDRGQKCAFICLGRFVKAADLSHELQRSGSNFIGRNRWIEIEENLDIPAHACNLTTKRLENSAFRALSLYIAFQWLPEPISSWRASVSGSLRIGNLIRDTSLVPSYFLAKNPERSHILS